MMLLKGFDASGAREYIEREKAKNKSTEPHSLDRRQSDMHGKSSSLRRQDQSGMFSNPLTLLLVAGAGYLLYRNMGPKAADTQVDTPWGKIKFPLVGYQPYTARSSVASQVPNGPIRISTSNVPTTAVVGSSTQAYSTRAPNPSAAINVANRVVSNVMQPGFQNHRNASTSEIDRLGLPGAY